MATVWLFEPRSHGRNSQSARLRRGLVMTDGRVAVQATLAWEEKGSHSRARRGPVAGATTKF